LGVTRSGYYAWRARPLSARAQRDRELATQLRIVHAESRGTYGRPRLQQALRVRGFRVGEKRLRRLMHAAHITARGRRRFRVTTNSAHAHPIVANRLARHFQVATPNTVWAADVTAFWTREGWCFLAVVLDLASRRVVGWAVRPTLDTALVLAALHLALGRRRLQPGVIHHSDRGRQYTSAAYQQTLARHGMIASMSRVGDCWDNAPVESFFSSLKAEVRPERPWHTRTEAQAVLAEHLESFYNGRRLHSALGYQTPAAFETKCQAAL
jgi:transposase InsO family protein